MVSQYAYIIRRVALMCRLFMFRNTSATRMEYSRLTNDEGTSQNNCVTVALPKRNNFFLALLIYERFVKPCKALSHYVTLPVQCLPFIDKSDKELQSVSENF